MRDFQNNVSKCLPRKYTNIQVHKYTIQHKYTIRHKYSLVQTVAKSYALHVSWGVPAKHVFLKIKKSNPILWYLGIGLKDPKRIFDFDNF